MSLLSAHWFDAVLIVILVVGFRVGKYKETLPQLVSIFHLLLTLFITTFLYEAPSIWIAQKLSWQPDTVSLILFPLEFLLVFFLLNIFRKRWTKNIGKKEPFGSWEFRTTKMAGALRFFTLTLIVMAWISGRYVTAKDIENYEAFCKENFGGITFPTLRTINNDMYNGSFSGRFAKNYLHPMLMTAIPRVDYGEKPTTTTSFFQRKVKLRELNNEFEKTDSEGINIGGDGNGEMKEGKEPETHTGSSQPPSSQGANRTVYRDFTLRGISGSGEKLFALINDETIQAGESINFKINDERIALKCLRIMKDSALVQLENKPEPIELRLGVATNLKGEKVQQ